MCAAGDQSALALRKPDLGLPADVLDTFRLLFEPPLQMPTHLGRIALGPGAFDERAPCVGMPGFRDCPLPAPRTRGICRGNQPQARHELTGVLEACESSEFGHRGHRHGTLHAAQGLESVDHRASGP
jgi:hypothetical protein